MTGNDETSEHGGTSANDRASERGASPTHNGTATADPHRETVTFGVAGVKRGFLTCLPVAVGVAGFGIAFGVVARQAGLSVAEATLMSATVLAGASQLVAVELWADPVPVVAVIVATFAINLRYSLMGAALEPWFRHLTAKQTYGSLFFMADENWALTMRELQADTGRGAFLLGSGLAMWVWWVGSTAVGATVGGVIDDPARYGVDFVLAAVFVALAVELWEGRSTVVPWLVALGTAVLAASVLPGQWYVLLGGAAAGIVEVLRHDS